MSELNREGWLTELAKRIEKQVFQDFALGAYRLTCGWPSKNAVVVKSRRIGECHDQCVSTGNIHEIFISPVLDDNLHVAGTVCHELAHIAAGIQAAHGKQFAAVCRHVGLTSGKPAQVMPGAELNQELQAQIAEIGSYPHRAMTPRPPMPKPRGAASKKVLTCQTCGCQIIMAEKWLREIGLPSCGCGADPGSDEGWSVLGP